MIIKENKINFIFDKNTHYFIYFIQLYKKGGSMKKLVFAVLAMVFLAGSAFAVDGAAINLKVGLDVAGGISGGKDFSGSEDVKAGFSLAAEYLFKFNDVFKLGAGLEYQIPREVDINNDAKISYMPIYISAEVSPIAPLRELYFKGNLGYNVLFDWDIDAYKDQSGGVYFALGAGYVFDFGLILEAMYSYYYATFTYGPYDGSVSYGKLGLNVGYRFNI